MKTNDKKSASENTKKTDHKPVTKTLLTVGSITILVLATVSFIFLPAMAGGSTKKLPPFGKYNGKPIEYAQNTVFANMVAYFDDQAKKSGQQIDNSAYYQIFSSAFNSAVINMAFTDEVKESGYIVPEKLVDRTMIPYFHDTNGVFSPRIFRDTPDSKKIELRKNITDSSIYQRYVTDIFGDSSSDSTLSYGLKFSSAETSFINTLSSRQRSFELTSFATSSYPDAEASSFAKENASLFDKLPASVITVDTEEKAKSILAQLKNSEITFEDAVKEFSGKNYSKQDGILTNSYKYQIKNIIVNEADYNAVIALASGDTSSAVQTKIGYSIFKAIGPVMSADFADDKTVADVKEYLKIYETGRIEDYFTARAKDFADAAASSSFDAACASFGVEKKEVPAFALNYGENPLIGSLPKDNLSMLEGAESSESFLKTAFSLKANEISAPIVLGSNVIVLKMKEETVKADGADSLSFLYPYYTSQFDQSTVQSFIMASSKLENDFINVYFKHFLSNN